MNNKNIKYIRITCSVTNDNKIALNRKKNTILRVLNGKIEEFEIEYTEFEMEYFGRKVCIENNDIMEFPHDDEEIKKKVLEILKYTPYLEKDKLVITKYEQ